MASLRPGTRPLNQMVYDWLVHRVRKDKERLIAVLSESLVRDGDCILYTKSIVHNGYARLSARLDGWRGCFMVHHVFWVLANKRPVPDHLELDHTCGRRNCINPPHLHSVTRAENLKRRDDKKANCPF